MALLMFPTLGLAEDMWGPSDSVKALDVVEKALTKITSIHMSPEESKRANHVADDVRKAISAVESSSNLTKVERNAKIGSALKELADLEGDFKQVKEVGLSDKKADVKAKMAKLQKELAEKKQ